MSKIDEEALEKAYNRALTLEKAGRLDAAATAYREVLNLDPEDHGGASVRLAAIKRGNIPDKAPDAYVATLFDQHAEVFEDMLVGQLGYHVPLLVRRMLDEHAPGPYSRMLDLGCGSGLAGVALQGLYSHATGIDLSETMIEVCDDKEVYDDLYVGEAVGFLEEIEEVPWDLIIATDVLPYVGDVQPLFAGVKRVAMDDAVWVFSTETLDTGVFEGRGYTVGPHHRFHHDRSYIESELNVAGFHLIGCDEIVVRHEEGQPAPGHLYLTRSLKP